MYMGTRLKELLENNKSVELSNEVLKFKGQYYGRRGEINLIGIKLKDVKIYLDESVRKIMIKDAELEGLEIYQELTRGVLLEPGKVEVEIINSKYRGKSLEYTGVSKLNIRLEGSEISGIKLGGGIKICDKLHIKGSKIKGIELSNKHGTKYKDIYISSSEIGRLDIGLSKDANYIEGTKVIMDSVTIKGVEIREGIIKGLGAKKITIKGTNYKELDVSESILKDVNIDKVKIDEINLKGNIINDVSKVNIEIGKGVIEGNHGYKVERGGIQGIKVNNIITESNYVEYID